MADGASLPVSLTTSLGSLLEQAGVSELLGHRDRANAEKRLAAWQVKARAEEAEEAQDVGGYRQAKAAGDRKRRGGRVRLSRSRYQARMMSGGPMRR